MKVQNTRPSTPGEVVENLLVHGIIAMIKISTTTERGIYLSKEDKKASHVKQRLLVG